MCQPDSRFTRQGLPTSAGWKDAKNIVDCPRSDTRIASIVQQPEHTYQQFVRTSPKGKQQPMTTRIETAFQRAGVCSRTFAPNEGSIMLCCATNTNHRIGTVTKHRHEARTLTRADGTSASSSERMSAVSAAANRTAATVMITIIDSRRRRPVHP